MARPPRFTISALADLLRELRYAPPETLSRQMQAAEQLLAEIEPQRNYPEDYIRFRITAYRGERGSGVVFVGSALIGDLAKFIERLSASLAWPARRYEPRVPMLPEEVGARLNVSAVTLHRYRKKGLVAHQVVLDGSQPRLVYFEDAVERFISGRESALRQAARFSRIDARTRDRMIRRARRYAETFDCSLNEAATRLSARFGRSLEGTRRLLQQHDRRRPQHAIFATTGPLTRQQRRLILLSHDRAIPASLVAQRLSKSVGTIYRAAAEERAARLRGWKVGGVELPTFRLEGAENVILTTAAAQRLPASLTTGGDLVEWIGSAGRLQIRDELEETQCLAALHFLLWSAERIIDALDRHQPRTSEIDLAETRLRWASRMKLKLLAGLRAVLTSTVEIHLGRKLDQSPIAEVESAYRLMVTAGARAIDAFDPSRQGRLQQAAVHTLRTELARRAAHSGSATARARYERGTVTLPDLPQSVYPWRMALEWRSAAPPALAQLDPVDRDLLTWRFGWDGRAPHTCAEIATRLDRPAHRIVAAEQAARRRLAQLLRSNSR